MNPTRIAPGTLFICGPFSEGHDINKSAHNITSKEEVLNSYGFKTFNPLMTYTQMDIEGFSVDNFFKIQVSCLAVCEKVITLPEWDNCVYCKKLIDIARVMEKEVIAYSRFLLDQTAQAACQ